MMFISSAGECILWLLEENVMQAPEWLRPGLYGAACGAAALAVIGFSWGGWVTERTAQQMAADQSRTDVVAALSPVCEDQAKRDPQMVERVAALKSADTWSRADLVMKNGWATMPGTTEGNRRVANACAGKIGA
jgi:alpha/beta superfamily hydrolase